MKKVIAFIVGMLFAAATTAMAGGTVIVAGSPSKTANGGTAVTFSSVTPDGYSVDLREIIAVTTDSSLSKVSGATQNKGLDWSGKKDWVLYYNNNPAAFKGAVIYAFGTQEDWPNGGKILNKLDLQNPLAKAEVIDGIATFKFLNKYPKESEYYQPVILIIQFADGSRAWGGVPNYPHGQFVARNKHGAPQMWLLVSNREGKILPPGKEGKELARMLE